MQKPSLHCSSMAALVPLLVIFLISLSRLTSSAPSDNYIVYMDSSARPEVFTDHHSWYSATLSSISDGNNHIYTYSNAIHGFCARLSASELDLLKNCPGYIASTRDFPVTMHTTRTPEFLGLNSATGAWPASSLGKDVIIGIVDTGIWPESASFSDEGMTEIPARWRGKCAGGFSFNSSMCNRKLIGARFFNKGFRSNQHDVTIPMASARDFDGHGTHTSSISAGNFVKGASFFGYAKGTARGMAPMARVAMYKAMWVPSGYVSDMIAAIDQAIVDGVDVISLSFGTDGIPLYMDPIAITSFAAMEKGIFVAASAGNRGREYGTVHGGVPWLLNVAGGTMDRDLLGTITLGNGGRILGTSLYHGNSTVIHNPLVFMKACNSVRKLKQVKEAIIVCKDTNFTLIRQIRMASAAGVAGAVFVSNSTVLDFLTQTSIPAVFLGLRDGQTVVQYIQSLPKPTISMDFRKTLVGVKPAPMVASYSSSGPSPSCPHILKPDLMAPGSLVIASWAQTSPVAEFGSNKEVFSKFNIISGTSMACPHAAGVAALLIGAHPNWSPAAIRSAMITTADYLDNKLEPIKEVGFENNPASPLAMGAGHINPNKALNPGLIYDATADDYVRLLCGMNFTMKHIQMITRSSNYNCSNPSLDLNYPSFIAFFNANDSSSGTKTVQNFHRTVTNVGDGQSHYTAKLDPLPGFEVNVVPKKLEFKHKYEKRSYKLSLKMGTKKMKKEVVYGSLSWVDVEGNHIVRSPIVATRISLKSLFEKLDPES